MLPSFPSFPQGKRKEERMNEIYGGLTPNFSPTAEWNCSESRRLSRLFRSRLSGSRHEGSLNSQKHNVLWVCSAER